MAETGTTPLPPSLPYPSIHPALTIQQLQGACSGCRTRIRHPVYPQGQNLLLMLYAPNYPSEEFTTRLRASSAAS